MNDGRWNYTSDAENRLIKVESRSDTPSSSWRSTEWTYDALGRRIQQVTSIWTNNSWFVVENLKFVSDPMLFGRHIVELNGTNNTLVRGYAWGIYVSGSLSGAGGVGGLAWVTLHTASGPASGSHFTCYDGNGNIVALVSATTGDVTARYECGPFGEPIRMSGPGATLNPFRFSTKRVDPTTDLLLYEYRPYRPTLGRWLSRDPKGESAGLNLYGALVNAPLNTFDGLGLQTQMSLGLYLACVCGATPLELWEARRAMALGMAVATQAYPKDRWKHAAMRHCVASGILAGAVGCRKAACLGTRREDWQDAHGQPPREGQRGKNNNRVGRRCAGCGRPNADSDVNRETTSGSRGVVCLEALLKCCRDAIDSGKADTHPGPIASD